MKCNGCIAFPHQSRNASRRNEQSIAVSEHVLDLLALTCAACDLAWSASFFSFSPRVKLCLFIDI